MFDFRHCVGLILSSILCLSAGCSTAATNFYAPPDPLPSDVPGTLIRAEAIELNDTLCDIGNQTDYRVFEGYTHNDSTQKNMPLMLEWTAARFAGEPAATSCE